MFFVFFFFFNDTATTEIYTLSLHDALPISRVELADLLAVDGAVGLHEHGRRQRRHAISARSEEHTSELQSHVNLVCRLLLEKKKRGGEGELLVTPAQMDAYFGQEAQAWEALMYTKLRFFFNDTATTEIYTLSLHDALPTSRHAISA